MPGAFRKISDASILLLIFFLAKSALSIAVRSSTAKFFGAGDESDAYFAAFTVPQQISDFFIGGILFLVIIPVFLKRKAETDEETALKDVAGLLNLAATALLAVTALYFIFIPEIISFVFPGFKGAKLELAISLSRLFSPALILMGLSVVYISFYHAYREFLVPSLASLLFPLASLFSLWALPPEWGIDRLVYGNLAGCLAGLAIMVALIQKRVRWQWNWNFRNPLVVQSLILAWPVLINGTVSKVIPFVQKSAASRLGDGAVTLIDNSIFLTNAALLVVASPISTAVFPLMGEQRHQDCDGMVLNTFIRTMKTVFFLAVPAVVIILSASHEIVGILLQYGKYTAADAEITARLIMIMAIMIIPHCFSTVGGRLFFVFQETKLISFCGMTLALLSCPLYYILADRIGIEGIAVAYTVTYVGVGFLIYVLLRIRHKGMAFGELYGSMLKLGAAGVAMALACFAVSSVLSWIPAASLRLAVISAAGISAYLAVAHLIGIDELELVMTRLPLVGALFGRRTEE